MLALSEQQHKIGCVVTFFIFNTKHIKKYVCALKRASMNITTAAQQPQQRRQ